MRANKPGAGYATEVKSLKMNDIRYPLHHRHAQDVSDKMCSSKGRCVGDSQELKSNWPEKSATTHPLPRSALCTARQPGFHHPRKQAEPTVSPTHGLPQPTLVFAPFTDRTTKASTPQMTSPIGLKMKRGTSFTFNAQSAPGPLTMAAAVSMVWHARVQESCL